MDYLVDQLPYVQNLSPEARETVKKAGIKVFMWADWMCGTRDPRELFFSHPSFFLLELVFLFLGLLTFIHAYRTGGRYLYLWLGLFLHGLNTELLSYLFPWIDNFWHAQSVLMFFGRRLPVYVLLGVYPFFGYVSSVAAKRLRLPWWATGPATGLGAVLLDLPYDVLGAKLLWWTWHDSDPNIFDRFYYVPWTSLYFHAAFACSFTWLLDGSRKLLLHDEYDWKLFVREFMCAAIAGAGSFWLGALQFVPVYHSFHDLLGVPAECCCLFFLFFYLYLVWIADRNPKKSARPKGFSYWFDELALGVLFHFLFLLSVALLAEPEGIVSVGLHQPIGPCDQFDSIPTVSGKMLQRRRFLCPTRYDEPFNWRCAVGQKPPKMQDGRPVEWYGLCGTPFSSHPEYLFLVGSFCLFGLLLFYQALANSGETPLSPVKQHKKKKE